MDNFLKEFLNEESFFHLWTGKLFLPSAGIKHRVPTGSILPVKWSLDFSTTRHLCKVSVAFVPYPIRQLVRETITVPTGTIFANMSVSKVKMYCTYVYYPVKSVS